MKPRRRATNDPRAAKDVIEAADQTLLDLVDHVLTKGVVIHADVVLALANVDLVYVRLSALVTAADRLLPRRPA